MSWRRLICPGLLGLIIHAPGARAEVITIAGPPGGATAPALIARDLGYFKERGIQVNPITISLMANIPPALVSGSVQIGLLVAPIVMQAVENGIDLVAVAGWDRSTQERAVFSLLAAADSGIHNAADLRGKRVAIPTMLGLFDLAFRRWLMLHGLQFSDVQAIELPYPQMADLMRSHQIDAALMTDPFRSNALDKKVAVLVADYPKELAREMLVTMWVARRDWAESHVAEIKAFRDGLFQGLAAWRDDPNTKPIEMKYLHSEMDAGYKTQTPGISPEDLRFAYDITKQFGLIEGTFDPDRLLMPQ